MKKLLALLLALTMVLSLGTVAFAANDKPSIGFVTFGLGGDFFQALADQFVKTFEANGWQAQYADGQFDPSKQIEASENFIAMGVDVLVIWSVAPEAMNPVIEEAQAAGIKVIAFVAPTEKYDALMVSDDAELADDCARMAAKWIDEHFADAEDHSVPVAVFSCRTAETGVIQADELLKIAEFSDKAAEPKEVELQDENAATGLAAAENLYITDPEIQVFLTPHNALGQGINSYFTGLSSPVTDYTDMAIFSINGTTDAEIIKSSAAGESPLRGTVLTGGVEDTANEMLFVANGLMDGSVEVGHVQKAGTIFVNADTVDEYLETGTVTSVTAADFKKAE